MEGRRGEVVYILVRETVDCQIERVLDSYINSRDADDEAEYRNIHLTQYEMENGLRYSVEQSRLVWNR